MQIDYFTPDLFEEPEESFENLLSSDDGGMSSVPDFLKRIIGIISGSKRKSEEENTEYTTLTKYRRVDSAFPKVISKPFDDDLIIMSKPSKKSSKMSSNHQSRKSTGNSRLFSRPKYTTKRVVNSTAYADIEFSDDDEDDIIITTENGFPISATGLNVARNASGSSGMYPSTSPRQPKKVINIPIQMVERERKPPPPPLIEPKSGAILAQSLMPELRPIRKQPPGLLPTNFRNGHASTSSNNFNDLPKLLRRSQQHNTATPSPAFNGHRRGNNSYYHQSQNSILAQETQNMEKATYASLLRALVPGVYDVKPATSSCQSQRRRSRPQTVVPSAPVPVITLDDDSDEAVDEEVIDLDDDDIKVIALSEKYLDETSSNADQGSEKKASDLPFVEPVNSLKEKFMTRPVFEQSWLSKFATKWNGKRDEKKNKILEAEEEVRKASAETSKFERDIQDKIKSLRIVDPECVVIDDFPEPLEEEEEEIFELTKEQENKVNRAIYNGPDDEGLVSKFSMTITRRDIRSLVGGNWLNDEVINFYMNLLTERGEQRQNEGLPRVYTMNTFFIPRLMSGGHSAVRRWTRKVDIFAYDLIPVPVHVGGVHWCMAIIDLAKGTIKYYDSMGTPNPKVLAALENYLRDESMDKKKKPFDTSGFVKESVADCPRQMNGSDCGVFSCMFAEYTSRGKEITFDQQHMPFFRRKMIFEIITGQLLN